MKNCLKAKPTLGFTLIELLAVIIILGVIAAIIIPKIQNSIKDSKKSASEISIHALEREADNFYLLKKSEMKPFTGCTYNFTTNTNTCDGFEFTGEKPESGSITIGSNGFVSYALKFKQYCYMNYGQSEPIVEEYDQETCKIEEPSSFETDDWKTISVAVKSNNTSMYNVGDTKEITLEGFGTHTVRIANMSTPDECKRQDFSQTACGFVVEFADIITNTYKMNGTSTNVGGWPASEMRTLVNGTIYNALPTEVKNAIIPTTVVSSHGSTSGETDFTSTDKLYLLSTHEVFEDVYGNTSRGIDYYDTSYSLTRQLDYYKNNNVTTSNYSLAIKKISGSADSWWLRSARSNTTNIFYDVSSSGRLSSVYYSNSTDGVAPAFRILD